MMRNNLRISRSLGGLFVFSLVSLTPVFGLEVKVNREDIIDLEIPKFNNGASPGWNYGSPMVVRKGDDIWFSLSRPIEGVLPYANTIWQIYKRQATGWNVILQAKVEEREPAPLVLLNSSTLAVFVNPKISFRGYREENQANLWNSHPHLLSFPVDGEVSELVAIEPWFFPDARFREHTYRGIAVNSHSNEILLVNQDPDSELYYPSYLDPEGNWHALDAFTFPIRSLYANLHIRDGEAHIFVVGDIPEPVTEWREAKYEVLKRHWDYAFRILNYAWTSDVRNGLLEAPLTIENIDDRPSSARNLDMLVEEDGTAHLLYLKRRFQYAFMRDKFFPGEPLSVEIGYARVKQGVLLQQHPLLQGVAEPNKTSQTLKEEVLKDGRPDSAAESAGPTRTESLDLTFGRLHRLEDGRILVVYSYTLNGLPGMRITVLDDCGRPGPSVEVPLKQPLGATFFTNTERGGSAPGNKIDLLELGYGEKFHTARYAEIEVIND